MCDMKVRVGDYGVVRVISGAHEGKLGFYDNESDDGKSAIVYFGEPLVGPWELVAFKQLERVDIESLDVQRFKRDHPALARAAGIK
jgi:hypothetical protein